MTMFKIIVVALVIFVILVSIATKRYSGIVCALFVGAVLLWAVGPIIGVIMRYPFLGIAILICIYIGFK